MGVCTRGRCLITPRRQNIVGVECILDRLEDVIVSAGPSHLAHRLDAKPVAVIPGFGHTGDQIIVASHGALIVIERLVVVLVMVFLIVVLVV